MNRLRTKISSRFKGSRAVGRSTDRVLRCERLEDRHLLTATVISTLPLTASASVPVDTNIEATFDASISPATVTDQSFVVHSRQTARLLSSLGHITSLAGTGAQITLDPSDNFYPGELVQVTATAELLDTLSMEIEPHVWDFRTAATGGTGTFNDSGQLLGNTKGWLVALGDVDSDGDLDAFVTSFELGGETFIPGAHLWINQGGQQGGFVGQFIDSGQELEHIRPHDIALGDLDEDGDLDAFFANSSGKPNTLWFNQGGLQGGTEGVFVDSGQRMSNSYSRGVSLGDLDADGDLDAFISNRKEQPNRVWINQGGTQGGTPGQFLDSGQLLGNARSYDVELGDLDRDGDLDAFVANRDIVGVPNRVWLNDGTGTFSDNGQLLGDSRTRSVALGDLDGDGDLDAYAANRFDDHTWVNQGGAQGGTEGQFLDSGQVLDTHRGYDVGLGDFDGDGDLDAFVASAYAPANFVWINQGGAQGGVAGQLVDSGQRLGSSDSRGVALGDLDNDGDIDAFVTNRGDDEPDRVWFNQSSSTLSANFDLDDNIDGADFLIWQRNVGVPSGATLADGDADGNGSVDGADLVVWESQFGTAASSVAASLNSQSVQPSTQLAVAEPTTSAPLQPVTNTNVWLKLPSRRLATARILGTHHLGTTSSSLQQTDNAFEHLYLDVDTPGWRGPTLRLLDEDLELLSGARAAGYNTVEERADTALDDWDGTRVSTLL